MILYKINLIILLTQSILLLYQLLEGRISHTDKNDKILLYFGVNPNFIMCTLNKTGMVFLYWLCDMCFRRFSNHICEPDISEDTANF
jgi:hypothetical protein